ncbi:hypothetical protein Rs2_50134 [Raphanus sativus]|nr:hypothetical protein Rs2_50134 [Raphanus sativus]
MASLLQMGSPLIYSNFLVKTIQRPQSFTCTILAKTTPGGESPVVPRRSAKYQPSLWNHHNLLSVENKYTIEETSLSITMEKDLYATALEFRLLRQHGFNVSEDVFNVFMENCGRFESDDINGLISLYEASYLSTKSDIKLQKFIRFFAAQQLRDFVDTNDIYGKRPNKNPVLIELVKLDFNIVQAVHQEELKYVSSWWRETGLASQLHFARDRIWRTTFGLLDKSKSLNLVTFDE